MITPTYNQMKETYAQARVDLDAGVSLEEAEAEFDRGVKAYTSLTEFMLSFTSEQLVRAEEALEESLELLGENNVQD